MYKNNWKEMMSELHDAFCFEVGLASVSAKYRDSKKFAERVCYAHDVLQKIEQHILDDKFEDTVVKLNNYMFRKLFKKLIGGIR